MVKKIFFIFLPLTLLLCSCATYQTPAPSLYIGNLPPSIVSELSLDERILTEEAWKNLKEGKGNKAKKIISKLGSESPFYYVGLGYVYYLLNDRRAAEEFFKASLRDYPNMTLNHFGLAQIYQEIGDEELAFVEYREILKREPENPWAKSKYENIKIRKTGETLSEANSFLASGNLERSKAAFLKALYYSPMSTEAHLNLANIYKKEKNYQTALVHLKTACFNEPENVEIQKDYAETLFMAGENKKSLDIYEKLNELEPGNKKIEERLQTIKNRLGIYELPSQYNSIQFSEAVSKEEMAALIGIRFKNILKETPGKPPIIIDISTSWASNFILKTASLGIIDVYPNHTFQPKKIITRAEMAEILLSLIDRLKKEGYNFIQQIPPEKIQISDVSPDNYYYQPIVLIISYDIMTFSLDKIFNPDLPVSGHECIKFLNIIEALIK